MTSQIVAVLGASQDPERFAYKAFVLLQKYGHTPIPVSPNLTEIEGIPAYSSLNDIPVAIDTLTVYVNPQISNSLRNEILETPVRRVIFNPGTENSDLAQALETKGVEVIEDCTLVMLRSGCF